VTFPLSGPGQLSGGPDTHQNNFFQENCTEKLVWTHIFRHTFVHKTDLHQEVSRLTNSDKIEQTYVLA
jgi:hypothetical protein